MLREINFLGGILIFSGGKLENSARALEFLQQRSRATFKLQYRASAEIKVEVGVIHSCTWLAALRCVHGQFGPLKCYLTLEASRAKKRTVYSRDEKLGCTPATTILWPNFLSFVAASNFVRHGTW